MLPQTLTGTDVLPDLISHRGEGSVSIYLAASRLPNETDTARLTLKNLAGEAGNRLREQGLRGAQLDRVSNALRDLHDDEEFWHAVDEGVAIFVSSSPSATSSSSEDGVLTYTFPGPISERLTVGERFDVGPVVRAATSTDDVYVISVTRKSVHLRSVRSGHASEVPLELPDDLGSALAIAENSGASDRLRAGGVLGDRPELERYAAAIDTAVGVATGRGRPLILNASNDLAVAYRHVSTHPQLLEAGIEQNPESLSADDIAQHAARILDEYQHAALSQWRETFGTRRANALATSRIAEVALAATAAAVEYLLFNPDVTVSGTIDEQGYLTKADDGYNVIDEIVTRVLANGGTVKGVRNRELVDGSPVAATLRFPLTAKTV